jgi:ATP-dependent Clp protease ATP-binding subunit ClpC
VFNLTKRVKRLLTLNAQEEARRCNSDQVLPEHVIISMLREGGGTACKALDFLRIDLVEFRRFLEKNLPHFSGSLTNDSVPVSRRIESLVDAANEEAREQGDDFIGTEHILYAAFREQDSPVQKFLTDKAVDDEFLKVIVQSAFSRKSAFPIDSEFNPFEEFPPLYLRQGRREEGRRKRQTSTPVLDEFSRDLTALAKAGRLDPVLGRQREIERAVRILTRRTKNNPVLLGEPGVGKTAIVEGLAQFLTGGEVPQALAGKRILTLDLGAVIAGTKYRGEFEERLKKIMREIVRAGNIIIFLDEIHTIIGAGNAEGSVDASNMLKPALSRGEIQCIGATTLGEYRKYFEKDAALERRFQMILVEEPDVNATVDILRGLQTRYEEHHKVRYSSEAIQGAAVLAQRYITGRFMPDKAIDILDEAGAMKKLGRNALPEEALSLEKEITELSKKKEDMITAQDYEQAAAIRDKVQRLRVRVAALKENRPGSSDYVEVDGEDVRRVVAEMTGIPLSRLAEEESQRLLRIETELRIVGQDDAVRRIAGAVRRNRAGISSPNKPIGSFVFVGPTGVGKTFLAKRLAAFLFDSEEALVRIDMSDYMEKYNISRLVGSPPGYIGYEEGGVLTEKIRRSPYSVVLFDEIEKAHRDVFNLLLQVLEEGELQDGLGHTVNFRNTVIIMTSNAGVREISMDGGIGFTAGNGLMGVSEIENAALAELRRLFNPEFINRVDEVVVFRPLNEKQIGEVLDIQLEELRKRLSDQGFGLQVDRQAKRILIEKGWDPKFGARPMRRAVQNSLEDPLSRLLLEGNFPPGSVFLAQGRNGAIRFRRVTGKG